MGKVETVSFSCEGCYYLRRNRRLGFMSVAPYCNAACRVIPEKQNRELYSQPPRWCPMRHTCLACAWCRREGNKTFCDKLAGKRVYVSYRENFPSSCPLKGPEKKREEEQ